MVQYSLANAADTENMESVDTIIIGSGAGGLSTAICLAKAGQKVLVLEQHYVPGGWCHSFMLNGQKFSPGVHYIGQCAEDEPTANLYRGLGIANDLVFFRMNKNAYEQCRLGDVNVDLPAGFETLYHKLSQQFPAESSKIKKFLTLADNVASEVNVIGQMKTFWDHLAVPYRTRHLARYGLFSLKRVINWFFKDPALKAALSIQCGDHGLPPSKVSFAVHALLMKHYANGGYYPMGGGAGIVKAMTNAIKKNGGEIRVKQNVKKILIESGKAYGVEMEDGSKIFSKNVVSNADPSTTYLKLVGREHLSKKLIAKLDKTSYSCTSLILFLTLDLDVTKFGIDSGNIWSIPGGDPENLVCSAEKKLGEDELFPAVFISCTTLKDPASFNGRYHNFEVVTFVDYESFREFSELENYQSPKYLRLKDKLIRKFMNNIERHIPGAREHVVQAHLGTPKTNEHFIHATRGNVYGTEKRLTQMGGFGFTNRSEITGLYLCGASTLSHGVAGASYSGVNAAASILGGSQEKLLKNQAGQHLRIYDAEDPSSWPAMVRQKTEDKKRRQSQQQEII
jgi:phytoene dehydrogenase-like protein